MWTVGDLLIRVTQVDETRQVRVERLPSRVQVFHHDVARGQAAIELRSHGALMTVWDSVGRIHVLDLARLSIVSSIRAML